MSEFRIGTASIELRGLFAAVPKLAFFLWIFEGETARKQFLMKLVPM